MGREKAKKREAEIGEKIKKDTDEEKEIEREKIFIETDVVSM
jgi:hypothetical protein